MPPDGVEPATWFFAERGRALTATQYLANIDEMHRYARRLHSWWEHNDILITPTMSEAAPPIGELKGADVERIVRLVPYTAPYNISGQPGIALPLHWTSEGLPLGIQLISRYGGEDVLIRLASQIEAAAPWIGRRPPVSRASHLSPHEICHVLRDPCRAPWNDDSEYLAYQNTIEQAVLGDEMGFHSFWTVEHHFLEEYSHCSNPEVLYGAIAMKTKNMRLGYGVRLLPKPYNHPVRSAESAAVLDLISGGRVEFGTGRSSTRAELEGFGIHPHDTREMWQEALSHIVGCWTNDEYEFEGKHWSMPKRRVLPKPRQKPHPPLWGATGSPETHRLVGEMGLGLLSFSVGTPPRS